MSLEENTQGNREEELLSRILNQKTELIAIIAVAAGITLILISYTAIPISESIKDSLRTLGIALVPGGFITIMIEMSTKREYTDLVKNEIKNTLQKTIPEEIPKILKKLDLRSSVEMNFDDLKFQLLTDDEFREENVTIGDIKLDNYINITNISTKPMLLMELAKHFASFIEKTLREQDVSDSELKMYKILCPTPEYNPYLSSRVAEELNLPSIFVRGEKKPGKGFYDGNIRSKDKFILLNDVTLTGKTAIERIDKIQAIYPSIKVKWAFAVFERRDKGADYKDIMDKNGIKFFAMDQIDNSSIGEFLMRKDRGNSKP